jgi:hypothetical protein
MFATGRGSLHGLESDSRIPSRLRGLVGPRPPSTDTIGRVYVGMDSHGLREMLRDIENDCFNTLCTHWGLDHCYKHDPTAVVNFTLTLFIVFVLLQCFWLRNLKPQRRVQLTLIALARGLDRTLGGRRAPWYGQLLCGP